jgi:hypothetical protein
MSHAKLRNIWSHLPAWAALLLTSGAPIGDARADRPELRSSGTAPEASQSALRWGEVAVRIDGETIYTSQDGTTFEELRLGDTAEAAHLKKLLREKGADDRSVSVPVGSMIVASGGGSGKGEKPKSSRITGNSGSGK